MVIPFEGAINEEIEIKISNYPYISLGG